MGRKTIDFFEDNPRSRYAPEGWGAEPGTPSYHCADAFQHLAEKLVPRIWALRQAIALRNKRSDG